MSGIAQAATIATAVGCALNGGVFFAFSTFVMAGLGRLPAPQGVAAMQSINVVAVTPAFMSALFGTALACLALIVWALAGSDWPTGLVAAGGAVYLAGAIVVTIAANVPLNDRLARATPASDEAARLWAEYLARWTRWNHVRTVASLAAAALLAAALVA